LSKRSPASSGARPTVGDPTKIPIAVVHGCGPSFRQNSKSSNGPRERGCGNADVKGWPQPPPALGPSFPPPGPRNAAALPLILTIAICSRKCRTSTTGHGAFLSTKFGLSSNSALTSSLPPNNESPTSPSIKGTVPATMSQCGCARNKANAFVIFASFCSNQRAAACVGYYRRGVTPA